MMFMKEIVFKLYYKKHNPFEKNSKKLHAWGVIKYNFKSKFTFYNINFNINNKII